MVIYFLCPTFGRIEMTRAAILSIEEKFTSNFKVIILDDKPPFLTYNALGNEAEYLHVIKGTGDLFWGGGVRYDLPFGARCDAEFKSCF